MTGDQGKTWHVANLLQDSAQPPQHWSWTLWTVKIPVDKNTKMVSNSANLILEFLILIINNM